MMTTDVPTGPEVGTSELMLGFAANDVAQNTIQSRSQRASPDAFELRAQARQMELTVDEGVGRPNKNENIFSFIIPLTAN